MKNLILSIVLIISLVSMFYDPVRAIINGEETDILETPWVAVVELEAGEGKNAAHMIQCHASVLNQMWALTYFKCIQKAKTQSGDDRETVGNKRIRLLYGSSSLEEAASIKVSEILLNDTYPDLALLKLSANITYFNNFTCYDVNVTDPETNLTEVAAFCPQGNISDPIIVSGVDLAESFPAESEELLVAGFGATRSDGTETSRELLHFRANYSANYTCGLADEDQDSYLCFGSDNPIHDACGADYGTPLVNSLGQQVGFYVKSQGDEEARKHCKGHGVYTRTDVARDWILSQISNFTLPNSGYLMFPSSSIMLVSIILSLFISRF